MVPLEGTAHFFPWKGSSKSPSPASLFALALDEGWLFLEAERAQRFGEVPGGGGPATRGVAGTAPFSWRFPLSRAQGRLRVGSGPWREARTELSLVGSLAGEVLTAPKLRRKCLFPPPRGAPGCGVSRGSHPAGVRLAEVRRPPASRYSLGIASWLGVFPHALPFAWGEVPGCLLLTTSCSSSRPQLVPCFQPAFPSLHSPSGALSLGFHLPGSLSRPGAPGAGASSALLTRDQKCVEPSLAHVVLSEGNCLAQ